jgi:hypothetical protein
MPGSTIQTRHAPPVDPSRTCFIAKCRLTAVVTATISNKARTLDSVHLGEYGTGASGFPLTKVAAAGEGRTHYSTEVQQHRRTATPSRFLRNTSYLDSDPDDLGLRVVRMEVVRLGG